MFNFNAKKARNLTKKAMLRTLKEKSSLGCESLSFSLVLDSEYEKYLISKGFTLKTNKNSDTTTIRW